MGNGTSDGDVRLASSLRFASAGESFAMAARPIATSSVTSTPHPLHITSICIISTRTAFIHIAYTRIPVTCTTSTSTHARRIPYGASTYITSKAHIHLPHTTHPHTSTGDRDRRRCLEA